MRRLLNATDEAVVSDLLVRWEDRAAMLPDDTLRELLAEDQEISGLRQRSPDVVDEVVSRLSALRTIDQIIGPNDFDAELPDVPGYEILDELGRGGAGVVYRARHLALGRAVAVKVLRSGRLAGQRSRSRFRAEADSIARLHHANIVQILDVGEARGFPYLVFEYVSGTSLKERLHSRPFSPRAAAELAELLARAVHFAHRHGIIHRDLKPSNVLIADDGIPKIADFGLAKQIGEGVDLTKTGEMVGTPAYMSPEQVEGRPVDETTDVYALGAILYELLALRPPLVGDTTLELLWQTRMHDPVPPRSLRPGLDRELEAICLKCLEKRPRRRYASAADLADDLRRWRENRVTIARPMRIGGRAIKWARRNSGKAGLVLALALGIVCLIAGLSWHNVRLSTERQRAEHGRREARDRQAELRELLYVSDMSIANEAYHAWHNWRLMNVLDRYLPGTGNEDLRDFVWYHLRGESLKLSVEAHQKMINGVAISPDGRILATGSEDGTVKLWGIDDGSLIATLHDGKQEECVNRLRFAPDGSWLASSNCDGTVKIWDVTSRRLAQTLEIVPAKVEIRCLALSPDGSRIVVGIYLPAQHQWVRASVWDRRKGEKVLDLPGHGERVDTVAYSPDGRYIATGGGDHKARIWDARDGRLLHVVDEPGGRVLGLDFSSDNRLLAVGSEDAGLCLVDLNAEYATRPLKAGAAIRELRFSADDNTLIGAYAAQNMTRWDVRTGQELPLPMRGHRASVEAIALSSDGTRLASGDRGGVVTVRELPVSGSRIEFSPPLDQVGVRTVAFDDALNHAVTTHADGTVRRWNMTSARLDRLWNPPTPERNEFDGAVLSNDARSLFIVSTQGRLRRIEIDTGETRASPKLPAAAAMLRRSGDGELLFVVESDDRTVQVVDSDTLVPLSRYRLEGPIRHLAVDATGQTAAAIVAHWGLFVLDARTGKSLEHLKTPHGPDQFVTISRDGELVAVGADKLAVLFRWRSSSEGIGVPDLQGSVGKGAFSPDGKLLLTTAERFLRICHVRTGQEMLRIEVHGKRVRQIRFSADGERIAYWLTGEDGASEIHLLAPFRE